ncbi:hypothetical protein GMDG_08042 [Pseudogymnoascus destructans 20631-21]|uniref:Uncharacterized protein n=1 Tax=Pseudogymnoascus destructans (strain ATCC MYA-4855 / 20631-21) TaxID=658429 RepID=L8G1B5_PSED2|nr:hypothetical protein GMDG_08042 [Pseudogymnoascus destructans 20631-21]
MVLKQDTGEKVSAIKSIPSKWSYTYTGTGIVANVAYNLLEPVVRLQRLLKVYSFVAASQISSFDGDLKAFYTYLGSSQGFSSSQYVTSIGAGTEPFVGTNALMKTSGHSVALNV